MSAELIQQWVATGAFLIAFVLGLRASVRLRRRYLDTMHRIDPRNRLLLASIVWTAILISVTVGWIGILSLLRIATDVRFDWTPPITLALSVIIAFIPVMFDEAISVVEDPDRDEAAELIWRAPRLLEVPFRLIARLFRRK